MSKSLDQQILEQAYDLVCDHWTNGALARDKNGIRVPVMSKEAETFCAMGALMRASVVDADWWSMKTGHKEAVERLKKAAGGTLDSLPVINDLIGQEAVKRLYERAIKGE